MNIYLVELIEEGNVAFEYDTYDSFVLTAKNKTKVKDFIEGLKNKTNGRVNEEIPDYDELRITKLGKYDKEESKIILGSFNAG